MIFIPRSRWAPAHGTGHPTPGPQSRAVIHHAPERAIPTRPTHDDVVRQILPDVSPGTPRDGMLDGALRDTVLAPQLRVANVALSVAGTDSPDLSRREAAPSPSPALPGPVGHVASLVRKKQVVRADAAGVVTRMADHGTCGNGAVRQLVCHAMRQAKPSPRADAAVVQLVAGSLVPVGCPFPTSPTPRHMLPKPLAYGDMARVASPGKSLLVTLRHAGPATIYTGPRRWVHERSPALCAYRDRHLSSSRPVSTGQYTAGKGLAP